MSLSSLTPIETTTKQLKDCMEPAAQMLYQQLSAQLTTQQQLLLDSIILSSNLRGYSAALDYAGRKLIR